MSAQLSAHFVERYPMGSPFSGGTIVGPPFASVNEKVTWVEKFVEVRACLFTGRCAQLSGMMRNVACPPK